MFPLTQLVSLQVFVGLLVSCQSSMAHLEAVSCAADDAMTHMMINIEEKMYCSNGLCLNSTNLLFDREGRIAYINQKPVCSEDNCSSTSAQISSSINDIGAKSAQFHESDHFKPNETIQRIDLTNFTTKPLALPVSNKGLEDVLCKGGFCCKFYIKTENAQHNDMEYLLSINNDDNVQYCGLLACSDVHDGICEIGMTMDKRKITFEKLVVSGNFSGEDSARYTATQSDTTQKLKIGHFNVETVKLTGQVTVTLTEKLNTLASFGIHSKAFLNTASNDNYLKNSNNIEDSNLIHDLLQNDTLNEYFSYVWFRMKILIVIVSIYVIDAL